MLRRTGNGRNHKRLAGTHCPIRDRPEPSQPASHQGAGQRIIKIGCPTLCFCEQRPQLANTLGEVYREQFPIQAFVRPFENASTLNAHSLP